MYQLGKLNSEKKGHYHIILQSIFRHFSHVCIVLIFISVSLSCAQSKEKNEIDQRPNIVLIVADDLGFGDIGCYGGEIETPNIDALASNGIRFSSFHTAPMCAPTRAMLLSGNDNHIAGMGGQGLVTEVFGYEGKLTDRIVTIPQLLRDAGYHTYMAGKWHLGIEPNDNPHRKGFEHSFVLLEGAGNHYTNQSALNNGISSYTEDGEPTRWKDGNYSTNYYTDKLIEYIGRYKADDQPFFAFAAYTSPHWPLQVDEKYWKKYSGLYNDGYEKLRERRLNSLKKAGIIPQNAILPQLHEQIKPWDSLSEVEKMKEARKMELYAGMVDNLDDNIGRLITYLKEIGEFENTLFVFISDNGAAHRDFINAENYSSLREYYNDDYENMGKENSYISYGPQWAEAGSAPFRYFKDYATEGGINTTMIISGAKVTRKNNIHTGFLSLLDLAPTFYDISGATYPEKYQDKEIYPLRGRSLLPYISGKTDVIHAPDYVFALEHYGNAMLRKGNWKITNFKRPFELENFALYNLSNDIGEQIDLKNTQKEKYEELLMEWAKFSEEVKIQIPAPSSK
ncbi:arylsulfatase [Paucihalobacter ruber]|uniref:Arylsulfatase n=1 Tax=Paucihalobacter ruber TaxID=2567861 RepID=A0A506PQ94_9FLAO|nr:arylsulfatase [Paucihalobacter ruber]TPV35407.1 arylsulfatase [Paucihalobacter ruber]